MTNLVYLQDFDVDTCAATVTAVETTEDGKLDVVLNQTCFYPRGGGQDWDTGIIAKDGTQFIVEEVRLNEDGDVHHIGQHIEGNVAIGDSVRCTVDLDRRSINTRLHSAGHVIDMAVDMLGLDWVVGKGQHYPHLSAVEYMGTWEPDKAEELRASIAAKANEFVQHDLVSSIRFMPVSEMHTVCKHVPKNIPTNKPARVVVYGKDFGIPCGGTHVKHLGQIGGISLPKVKEKKGVIRVSYGVEGINS